jgi:hypothetical protein
MGEIFYIEHKMKRKGRINASLNSITFQAGGAILK